MNQSLRTIIFPWLIFQTNVIIVIGIVWLLESQYIWRFFKSQQFCLVKYANKNMDLTTSILYPLLLVRGSILEVGKQKGVVKDWAINPALPLPSDFLDDSFPMTVFLLGQVSMDTKIISGIHFSSLPTSYIRSKSDRPKLSEVTEFNNIPVIDLGCEDTSLIIKQIGDACREYGFFQVTPESRINLYFQLSAYMLTIAPELYMDLYIGYVFILFRLFKMCGIRSSITEYQRN